MKLHSIAITVIAAFFLGACLPAVQSAPTANVSKVQTSAAQTVMANFTLTASAPTETPLPPPTKETPASLETSTAGATEGTIPSLTPTLSGGITTTPGLCDYYTWNEATVDVNVPDGTTMTPGQDFVKTWKIKNSGICTWGAGYKVVYAGYRDQMSGQPQPLNGVIGPGQEVEISVQFKAPTTEGEYVSAWTLANANGTRFFGIGAKPLYVKIVVKL